MPQSNSIKVNQLMQWYLCVVRPCTRHLVKLTMERGSGSGTASSSLVERALTAFTSNVCPRLEQMMTRMPGSGRVQLIDDAAAKLTVLDIVLYNELKTVLELCSLEGSNFADQFPKIDLWLKYVSHKIPQLQALDK